MFAASVLAANAVLRSLFGAAFPLFTVQMYTTLGIHWAASIPAFLALACVPFPIVLFKYGHKIRARCRYAAEAARILEQMHSTNRVVDEDEAEEEVADAERYQSLVKVMSKRSRRSQQSRMGSNAVDPSMPVPPMPALADSSKEKEEV